MFWPVSCSITGDGYTRAIQRFHPMQSTRISPASDACTMPSCNVHLLQLSHAQQHLLIRRRRLASISAADQRLSSIDVRHCSEQAEVHEKGVVAVASVMETEVTQPLPAPRPRPFPCLGNPPGPRCGHTLTAISGPEGDFSSAKLVLCGENISTIKDPVRRPDRASCRRHM